MFYRLGAFIIYFILIVNGERTNFKYEPSWDSLDTRPIPLWYDQAKVGIFIHWGVYSVPSYGSEWFWINWNQNSTNISKFMKDNYPPNFTYQEFAKDFKAEFFNPDEWANLFVKSGAQYVILTSKHHEGYALWPSMYSFSWNSVEVGPHRDLIGELADAIRRNSSLKFGLYHSLFEWFNPLYLHDKNNNFTTQLFVDNKIIPEMKELVFRYRPDIIWSDGEWEAPDTYWKSKEFLTWLYNESPVRETVVVNDRWGSNTLCKHGGFLTCADRYNPGTLKKRKFENAFTIDSKSWGFRRNANLEDFLSTKELVQFIVEAVSCNGNIAMNIGPTKEGIISPIYQERLLEVGKWLNVNGLAIYNSNPWNVCQNDTITPGVWFTTSRQSIGDDILFAIVLNWPDSGFVDVGCVDPKSVAGITMLGTSDPIKWFAVPDNITRIVLPERTKVTSVWAWTLKIMLLSENKSNGNNVNQEQEFSVLDLTIERVDIV